MAKMNVTPMSEGYPESRRVDGMNVEECAEQKGYGYHLGKIRKQRTIWTNSKTGKVTEPPDYAKDNRDY